MDLVSVIVPAYNVGEYLQQCLQSIACQSYARLEVIVVDDGSTDGSGRIADEWADSDKRFRAIHQPNRGSSAARNAGLDAATGRYIVFVDSDDFIAPQFVELMLAFIQSSGAQMALCGWHCFSDDGNVPPVGAAPRHTTLYGADEATDHILYQRKGLTHSPWGRIFEADVLRGVRFPVGMVYEDMAVLMPTMQRVRTVAYTPRRLYYYRKRKGSIMASFDLRHAQMLDILEDLERRAPLEFPQHLPAVRSRLLSAYFNMLRLAPRHRAEYEPLVTRSWEGVKRLRCGCFFDRKVRLRNKVGIALSVLGLKVLRLAFQPKPRK